MVSSIRARSFSSSSVSSLMFLSVGLALQSSAVASMVVSSTKESPGIVVSRELYTKMRWMHSNSPHSAVRRS
jgi:hypothetical protein